MVARVLESELEHRRRLTEQALAHVWGEIAFCWPGAARISSVFRGALSKQPQIF